MKIPPHRFINQSRNLLSVKFDAGETVKKSEAEKTPV
jgi:hypothetical protein